MIEGFERFQPQLNVSALGEVDVLEERYIPIVDAGSAEGIAANVADRANRRGSEKDTVTLLDLVVVAGEDVAKIVSGVVWIRGAGAEVDEGSVVPDGLLAGLVSAGISELVKKKNRFCR